MNVTVAGLWHLGSVTAACCARHFNVIGFDSNPETIDSLNQGKPPIHEPGLPELIQEGLATNRLSFTADLKKACAQADILWVTYDTPVNDSDQADVEAVLNPLRKCIPLLPKSAIVLLSSQLPVGTCQKLESEFPQARLACSPENLRLGKAIEVFFNPGRIVVGCRDADAQAKLQSLLSPFTDNLIWMRTESAEMVKHALNSFLALSITFINEIARLCELSGADAAQVAAGLKSDPRIGPRAYLNPGGAFAGGTLARDVVALSEFAASKNEPVSLVPAIKTSNDRHRLWPLRRLQQQFASLENRSIALLGLTYKPGTDTLRRSAAIELAHLLVAAKAQVRAYDPIAQDLPVSLRDVARAQSVREALQGADAAVVCTEWPEFIQEDWPPLLESMRQPLILDANGFLTQILASIPGATHIVVGQA